MRVEQCGEAQDPLGPFAFAASPTLRMPSAAMPSHAISPEGKHASSRRQHAAAANNQKSKPSKSAAPKKDGANQRAAQDVAGLKDYVWVYLTNDVHLAD